MLSSIMTYLQITFVNLEKFCRGLFFFFFASFQFLILIFLNVADTVFLSSNYFSNKVLFAY